MFLPGLLAIADEVIQSVLRNPRPLRPESDHSRHEFEMARWAISGHAPLVSATWKS